MLIIILIIPINLVRAEILENIEELKDITNDVEIRYKWYKEEIEGDYYPLKEKKEGYLIDADKIKYGPLSGWGPGNCLLPENYYLKNYDTIYIYQTIPKIAYIKLENLSSNATVKVYQNNQNIEYKIISSDTDNYLMINLQKSYLVDDLTFYISGDNQYKIKLYNNSIGVKEQLAKDVIGETLLIPDSTWTTEYTTYVDYSTMNEIRQTSLTKRKTLNQVCTSREIFVYQYKINREYYDNNYHTYVEGYIKDINDYQIFYQEKPITNTIEITKEITKEKIIKQPTIEYIYVPSENETKKIDSSETLECIPEIKNQIKTEYKTIEKEIFKTPTKIYIIIAIMFLIIIFLITKLIKKYVVQSI